MYFWLLETFMIFILPFVLILFYASKNLPQEFVMAAVLKNPEVLQCIDLEDISFVETLLCLALSKVHHFPAASVGGLGRNRMEGPIYTLEN